MKPANDNRCNIIPFPKKEGIVFDNVNVIDDEVYINSLTLLMENFLKGNNDND